MRAKARGLSDVVAIHSGDLGRSEYDSFHCEPIHCEWLLCERVRSLIDRLTTRRRLLSGLDPLRKGLANGRLVVMGVVANSLDQYALNA